MPCLNPLKLLKKPSVLPYTIMENWMVEMQFQINFCCFSPNPNLSNQNCKQSQLTCLYGFSISSLHNTPGIPLHILLSKPFVSLTIIIESRICLPVTIPITLIVCFWVQCISRLLLQEITFLLKAYFLICWTYKLLPN